MNFFPLVLGIKVQVQPASPPAAAIASLKRYIGPTAFRITKDNPAAARRRSRNILQSLLPKCDHALKLMAMDYD
ncbi:hypothetical protein CQ10_11830 [Bradyrhizobium valentinum]|uniref:Uncharacterized protein n=1 Tax=Bradyrhizobium valentinum TaxID=1518501 RepID=A0A0R3M0Y9_9BRAD|nr:hypothetical protein CP49_32420 [Bradyrhizobium valentinum]KRR11091.1 hypothetical protein CQ10_11830 [Bradyrhizobium valentinum]